MSAAQVWAVFVYLALALLVLTSGALALYQLLRNLRRGGAASRAKLMERHTLSNHRQNGGRPR